MDDLVAYVFSFRESSDIPYRLICSGTPKKQGGQGRKWSCNCISFVRCGGHTCKHLRTLQKKAKDGTLRNLSGLRKQNRIN